MALRAPVTPLLNEDWIWPTISEIKEHQHACDESEALKTNTEGVLVYEDRIWSPERNNLRLRICIRAFWTVPTKMSQINEEKCQTFLPLEKYG